MSQLAAIIKQLTPYIMGKAYNTENKIEKIILTHSVTAATVGLAGGFLPGAGAVIATVASTGAIWSMYYRLCQELGIKISQNILKTLSSAILTNIATNLGILLAGELAATFLPGVSLVVSAAACYGITYLAGFLFMKLLVNLFKAGKNPSAMTAEELAAAGKEAVRQENCKDIFRNAREEAKQKIRNGEISKEDQK